MWHRPVSVAAGCAPRLSVDDCRHQIRVGGWATHRVGHRQTSESLIDLRRRQRLDNKSLWVRLNEPNCEPEREEKEVDERGMPEERRAVVVRQFADPRDEARSASATAHQRCLRAR